MTSQFCYRHHPDDLLLRLVVVVGFVVARLQWPHRTNKIDHRDMRPLVAWWNSFERRDLLGCLLFDPTSLWIGVMIGRSSTSHVFPIRRHNTSISTHDLEKRRACVLLLLYWFVEAPNVLIVYCVCARGVAVQRNAFHVRIVQVVDWSVGQ